MSKRIRWSVRPTMFTLTHPTTGEATTVYDAVEVTHPEGMILSSELERAKLAARRALGRADGRTPVVLVTQAARGGGYAHVRAYWA